MSENVGQRVNEFRPAGRDEPSAAAVKILRLQMLGHRHA